jgi:hypothetical protein
MNSKHRRTLEKVFESPIRADVEWKDIEALILALGGKIKEARGSRITIKLNNTPAVFHRPHPQKETDKGALKSVRKFLLSAGINEHGI